MYKRRCHDESFKIVITMAYEIKQVKVVLLINICVYQLKKPNLTIWYRRKSLMEQLSIGLNAC